MMLDAKIKQLKREGRQDVKHKPAITLPDLQKLKVHPVLSPSTPLGLLQNTWFHTTLHWCRRGREGQRLLTRDSFKFLVEENNHQKIILAVSANRKVLRNVLVCTRPATTLMMPIMPYPTTFPS